MWKEKIKQGGGKERKKNMHTEGGKKNGSLIFLLSVDDKGGGNFKTYIKYNKLCDET